MENLVIGYVFYLGVLVVGLLVFALIGFAISAILKRKGK